MKKQCMVILVENNAGVLARVSSLFMQRGFNIDSLTVSSTENPKISRITVMTGNINSNKLFFFIIPPSYLYFSA